MIINKISKVKEDGTHDVQFQLTEDQLAFLVNFALNFLVGKGAITIIENSNLPQQEDTFLQNIDPKLLPQA